VHVSASGTLLPKADIALCPLLAEADINSPTGNSRAVAALRFRGSV